MTGWGRFGRAFGLVLGLAMSFLAQAENLKLPFGRTLDVGMLRKATELGPKELIEYINGLGIKTYLYPSIHGTNPDLLGIPWAPEAIRSSETVIDLMEEKGKGGEAEDVGLFIPDSDPELGKFGPFLIIASSANTHTLIHEFGHAVFYLGEPTQVRMEKSNLGLRAFQADRELQLQLRYLDRYAESSNQRHRDQLIEVLIRDVTIEGQRARDFATEEVVVETLLSRLITPGTRYYKSGRVKVGLDYAHKNIHLVYIRLERREYLFLEIRRLFEQVAGSLGHTSQTEREEIIETLQKYRAALDAAKQPVVRELEKLENPQWACAVGGC